MKLIALISLCLIPLFGSILMDSWIAQKELPIDQEIDEIPTMYDDSSEKIDEKDEILHQGAGLKCYTCSWLIEKCEKSFLKHYCLLNECNDIPSGSAVGCSKEMVSFHTSRGDDVVQVQLGCVYPNAPTFEEMSKLINDKSTILSFYSTCRADGCNGSKSLKSSAVPIILITMATCLFYIMLQH